MGPRRPPELYRAPFPLYALQIHPRGLALAAGGGGAARTGVRNGLHFLQLEQIGGQLSASLLHSHDTETRATMSMALAGDVIAAGQDASCHILRFRLQRPDEKSGGSAPSKAGGAEKGPRKRKASNRSEKGEGDTRSETGEVAVETLCNVQTDFSPEALQKAVRVSADHSLLATGGADGFLRVWEFPSMKKVWEFKAHDGEIEDIALGPDNKVVTAGRDFQCCVWQRDQLVLRLRWDENMPGVPDKTYRYQACRFGAVQDQAEELRLYTVQVPHKRGRRPPPCYLTKWDGKSFLPLLTQPCGGEVISCLSISDSGTFLGLGTVTGSVAIHVSFSLQAASPCGCCCCSVLAWWWPPSCCCSWPSPASCSCEEPRGQGAGLRPGPGDSDRLPCLGHGGTSPQGCRILACPAPPPGQCEAAQRPAAPWPHAGCSCSEPGPALPTPAGARGHRPLVS
ncbi:guanine nucleotide-exchange factor SEC12 isoform X1 [Natator depressus]|uniref:guanine nucleotide-exchange factor SEC12 isoform X1 n=1 Tax=Natator depressus TaxID=27790 RepID=UPI003EBA6D77